VKGVVLDWKKLSHPVDWYAATDDTPAENCNALCIGNRIPLLIQELLAMNPASTGDSLIMTAPTGVLTPATTTASSISS